MPASGLPVSVLAGKEEAGGTEEADGFGAKVVRKGLAEDMVQSGTMHCSMYGEEAREELCVYEVVRGELEMLGRPGTIIVRGVGGSRNTPL